MKMIIGSSRAFLTGLCALLVVTSNAWARLNVPRQHRGVIASIDKDASKIVLAAPKKSKFQLGKIIKPNTFAWSERTEFIKNGQPTTPAALFEGTQAEVHYWYQSKGKPVLVKVVWKNGTGQKPPSDKP